MFLVVSCTISGMTGSDGKRLAAYVVQRREELGLRTTKALAEKVGMTARALGDVENGRRTNYSPGTKARIEIALEWEQGSIDRVLSGGTPTPNPPPITSEPHQTPDRVASKSAAAQQDVVDLLDAAHHFASALEESADFQRELSQSEGLTPTQRQTLDRLRHSVGKVRKSLATVASILVMACEAIGESIADEEADAASLPDFADRVDKHIQDLVQVRDIARRTHAALNEEELRNAEFSPPSSDAAESGASVEGGPAEEDEPIQNAELYPAPKVDHRRGGGPAPTGDAL